MCSSATKEQVCDKLREIIDPEVGFNLVEMGLIYDEECNVKVTMTLSTKVSPLHQMVTQWVDVNLVREPEWNITMAEDNVKKLGAMQMKVLLEVLKDLYGAGILFFYYIKWFIFLGLPVLYFALDYKQNMILNILWIWCLVLIIKDFIFKFILKKSHCDSGSCSSRGK